MKKENRENLQSIVIATTIPIVWWVLYFSGATALVLLLNNNKAYLLKNVWKPALIDLNCSQITISDTIYYSETIILRRPCLQSFNKSIFLKTLTKKLQINIFLQKLKLSCNSCQLKNAENACDDFCLRDLRMRTEIRNSLLKWILIFWEKKKVVRRWTLIRSVS